MKKTLLNFNLPKKHFFVSCCLIFPFLIDQIFAETITIQGTVSVSTTTVKNAKVTFIAVHDSTVQYSTFTDDAGNYQIDVMATAIEPSPENLPTKFELNQNYPNPFSSETSISYNLQQPLKVKVTIYDILGRVVRKFAVEKQQIGNNAILWEGKNHLGQRLPAGVYFYQVRAGEESQIKKMVLCGDGGMNLGPSPVSASSHFPQAHSQTLVDLLEGYYRVRIENTDNTFPLIKNTIIENQTVYDNTPLDLLVDSQYPIDEADIYVDSTHQIIRGFGAANILQWRPDITDTEIETAFGNGIYQLGFTILRLRVQPQKELWSTNLPSAQKAHDMGAIIIAAPWNAPEEMLETVNGIKRVRHDMYEEYAAHLDSFVTYMNNKGIPLYGISVQNEPDIRGNWTSWTANEMLTFMKDYAQAITGTRVMAPESFNFSRSMSDPILNDSAACANTDIICGHIYGGGLAAYPLAESKGKEVWMTEHLSGENSNSNNWTWAFNVALEMNNVMNAGMNAYIWWYLVRYYGPISDGTNDCGIKGEVTKKGFVMSQFSKFIRPGFYRIECPSHAQSNIFLSAYKNSTSEVVVVIINNGSTPKYQTVTLYNGDVNMITPFTTSKKKNCEQGEDIPVREGKFTVLVEPSSITTFVSN